MASKNPNPQGKGGSLVLTTLDDQRAALPAVPPKQIDQVTTELFTSLFVLESDFRFKPIHGKAYYLYFRDARYYVCMTPPEILGEDIAGRFIGSCLLQPHMTWTLDLADEVTADTTFMNHLQQRREEFEQRLQQAERVDDVLPVYEQRLSFYSRALGFAVANSLGRSMAQAGISGLTYDEARGMLGHDQQ